MTDIDIRPLLEDVVQRLPDRLRADLCASEPSTRQAAEDALVAKIVFALAEQRQAA